MRQRHHDLGGDVAVEQDVLAELVYYPRHEQHDQDVGHAQREVYGRVHFLAVDHAENEAVFCFFSFLGF